MDLIFVMGNFSQSSTDIKLVDSTLYAKCKKRDGSYIDSSINLNECVVNKDGTLGWANDGRYSLSSKECSIVGGATLSCECSKIDGSYTRSDLNLDQKITNDDGFLKFN